MWLGELYMGPGELGLEAEAMEKYFHIPVVECLILSRTVVTEVIKKGGKSGPIIQAYEV